MTSFAGRVADSFSRNLSPVRLPETSEPRVEYAFWQRVLASFLRVRLPKPVQPAASRAWAAVPRARSAAPRGSWFDLPMSGPRPLLSAATTGVVLTVNSPDGTAEYFVHRGAYEEADFLLEVVARDAGRLPAIAQVRFESLSGTRGSRLILPVASASFGPASGQVFLTGFRPGAALEATGLIPVAEFDFWDEDVVAASVAAAATRATSGAWSAIRGQVPADVSAMITRALR